MPVEEISQQLAPYVQAFERTPHSGDQREAFERFLEIGFPTSRDEDWKFTNLSSLTRIPFELAEPSNVEAAAKYLEPLPAIGRRIVFINGRLAAGDSWTVSGHLGQYATPEQNAFVALNAAFLDDVASVRVFHGEEGETIHVVHVSLPGAAPRVSHPRNLFLFEEGCQATVVETYLGEGTYLTNAVTEVVVGAGAVVEHIKFQQESLSAFHISAIQIRQSPRSVFTSRSFAFGGALARTEINAVLDEGCECTLNGLYLTDGRRHVDTRTTIDHAKPHAASHELYKGILDGKSSAVFNGKIIVRKDAQKTDAKQTNKNLVLSEDSTINTKPQLEIFADDVRCTHGATVGQLDPDSIFYLRSRGIGAAEARELLIDAFAREIIDGVRDEALREYIGRSSHDYRR